MKFVIKKNIIKDVLSKIQGLTNYKSSLAITENVLIKTVNSNICFIATDLETGFEGLYEADIELEGIITINAKKLYEIVRDFPEEDILINEVKKNWIEIGNENVLYHIVGMNSDDFPDIPKIDDIYFYKIKEKKIKKMIERMVIISASGDDKRAHIIGIYFEIIEDNNNKIFRMVSTDGSRLSKVDYILDKDVDISSLKNIIVPKKGMTEVIKFLDSEGDVEFGFMENNFILKKDKEIITIRLLEGIFPEYDDIVDKSEGTYIEFNKYLFNMMLKRMSILSSEDYKSVIFSFEKNRLLITSSNPEIGESKEEMEIDFPDSKVEIAFNPKFFMDTFNVIDDEKVILNIVDEEHPCLIKGENDNNFLSIIMPMRI
jgi:DNA polymerase-3 subunit beta